MIPIEAEAFDITVEFKFPDNNSENLLDFQAVKVGTFKDQVFTIKNIGLYKVKFNFNFRKKSNLKNFKEMFKIEPMESELDPN